MTYPDSGVSILELRVSNFRSFQNSYLNLGALTILVGANNAGKTNLLDAITLALGTGRKAIGVDDIFVRPGESTPPRDRKSVIDVLIRPTGDDGSILDSFPVGSYWTSLWGRGIAQDMSVHDFVGIRATIFWDLAKGEYVVTRSFLKDWKPFSDWIDTDASDPVRNMHIEPIAVAYIDAQRDLELDLRARGSFWRRLTDDLGLTDAQIDEFEQALTALNEDLVEKSSVLTHIHKSLVNLEDIISANRAGINISPVPRTLRDLSRGVDVTLSTPGAKAFPLARHGMGTRSLASLLVFRAYVEWKKKQAHNQDGSIHPLLALEEPEAHLHPQAQRALYQQVSTISAQRLLSTHSPYISGQAGLDALRLVSRLDDGSRISALDLSKLTAHERQLVERQVIATKGDLLFSRALILYEGVATEDLAFPIWAQAYWGKTLHELGFSFVAAGGHNYFPYIWLATSFGIPWFIFSDGEKAALSGLDSSLKKAGADSHKTNENVIVITGGRDIEAELVHDGYLLQIEEALDSVFEPNYLDRFMATQHGKAGQKKGGVQPMRDYKSAGGRERAAVDLLRQHKATIATPLAEAISRLPDANRRVPTRVAIFFDRISRYFGLTRD